MAQRVWLRCKEVLDRALDAAQVRVVLDVGARDCAESADFARAYPGATVFAFECNAATLPQCRAVAAAEPRIVLTEKAVSDRAGRLSFYPTNPDRTITSFATGNPGASSLFEASGAYPEETYAQDRIEVDAIRLDQFCATHGLDAIDILWMDVQGAEELVLRGLGALLQRVKFIHLEAEFFEIYRGQALFPTIDALLRGAGFRLAGFTSYSQYAADALYAGPTTGFAVRAARRALPYLGRNLAKYRRHRLKRALRRALGLAEWPDAAPQAAPNAASHAAPQAPSKGRS